MHRSGVWRFAAVNMGLYGLYEIGSSFAVVQLRGENPYQLTLATSPALTSSAVYEGSNDVTSFTVSD